MQGAWKPSLNIPTVLTSLQLLMAEPNPDDPLMADIVKHPHIYSVFWLCFHQKLSSDSFCILLVVV